MARKRHYKWFDEYAEKVLPAISPTTELTPYDRYILYMKEAKAMGWRFKEGASDILDKRNFTATANMYKALVGEIGKEPEQVIFEEQLMVQPESVAQAVMLWNEHANLVAQYGEMDIGTFRDNEAEAFAILRAQYPDKKAYDMVMSY
jgi:uncharacterized protein YeaC (DUF1315 family)